MVARRVVLISGALYGSMALPLDGRAQPTKVFRIGWLAPAPSLAGGVYDQFLERARELGYTEGKNLAIEYRHSQMADEARAAANELVRLKVDLIVAQAPVALLAARSATRTVPIVTFFVGDPIRMGVTRSLARPAGNVTGFTWDAGFEGTAKALEAIKEIVPPARRVAILWNLENESHPFYVKEFEAHARTLRMSILSVGVRSDEEFEGAFRRMAEQKADAVIAFADPLTIRHRDALSALLSRYPIPAMWSSARWPLPGSVVTLGPNVDDQPRRAAEYMDRILKGTPAGSLPFQQPTRTDLIVDARVARALGLKLPRSLLLRADRVVDE